MSDPEPAAMNDFNRSVVEEFRANEGKVGGPFEGAPMLLLTSTGAKSGRQYTTPLVYTRDGDRLVVAASKGGAPTNPAWFHNLLSNPEAAVEVGPEAFPVRAVVTTGDERARLFAAHAERMPGFAEYAKKTSREIPVIALERLT